MGGQFNMMGPTPLPRMPFFVICVLILAESVSSTMLFPFVSFMVESFGVAQDERELGYYAGYLASSYFIAQFISSFFLGTLSDRIGRKVVLVVGTCGTLISSLLFGFSTNYMMAIIARSLGGLLNTNWAIAKSYIADITDSSNRAKGFSVISMIAGLGSIVGPLIGGVTAKPTESLLLKSLFHKGSMWETYPYALPGLIVSVYCVFSIIITIIYMKESPKKYQKLEGVEMKEFVEEKSMGDRTSSSASLLSESQKSTDWADDNQQSNNTVGLEESPGESLETVPLEEDDYREVVIEEKPLGYAVLKQRPVLALVISYATVSVSWICLDEVFPLWSLTSPKIGGLGFNSSNIGVSVAIGGLSLILFQLLLFARLTIRFGPLKLYRFGNLLGAFLMISYPFANLFAESLVGVWIAVALINIGRAVIGTVVFTSLNILLAGAAPNDIGTVNGVSMAFGGLMRSLGPAFGGNIFAWSSTNGLSFPFDYHFTFLLLSICNIVTLLVSYLYKDSPDAKKKGFDSAPIEP